MVLWVLQGIFASRNIATPSINQALLAFNHVEDVQLLNSHGQPLPAYRDHNKVGDVQEQVGYSGSQMLDFAGNSKLIKKFLGGVRYIWVFHIFVMPVALSY